jgi:hypothetical protein
MKNVVIALDLVTLISACGSNSSNLSAGGDLTRGDLSQPRSGPQTQDPYGRDTAITP